MLGKWRIEDAQVAGALQSRQAAKPAKQKQQSLFETPQDKLLKQIAKVDPSALTPRQALGKIAERVAVVKGR